MNYDSFSHGQVVSKVWLCEQLEPFVTDNSNVLIIGSWYNILGFMMLTRNKNLYQHILGIDLTKNSTEIADKLNDAWDIEGKLSNNIADAQYYDYTGFDLVINCSCEHMDNDWLDKINHGTLVCIQSSDVVDPNEPWFITNPNSTLNEFSEKYSLKSVLFEGTLPIKYSTGFSYNRFMKIGIK